MQWLKFCCFFFLLMSVTEAKPHRGDIPVEDAILQGDDYRDDGVDLNDLLITDNPTIDSSKNTDDYDDEDYGSLLTSEELEELKTKIKSATNWPI
ncbi:hypothetical protein TSAR_016609 [Trichomalopsis sarcophagae]|uniref:Uncharacterized protein n=1 Tax=Trichomalopsis sarcophagae TaxID=543379 RepID=A0A232FIT7_9HYME|nr:hypothetical protein TSAR_016609 [Trichomalopsis sarcophagae]